MIENFPGGPFIGWFDAVQLEEGTVASPYNDSACPSDPWSGKVFAGRFAEYIIGEDVDISLRKSDLTQIQGFQSVPVVEANGQFLVGNVTSAQLVSFLKQASESPQTTA